jgi:hypothetical protein
VEPLDYLFGLEHFGIKFGLENIGMLVAALGHPERAFPSVHIAGTNGKGSVTAMVDAGLRAAGHRSARFTSPHLIDLTERFAIDDRPVAQEALVAAVDDLRGRVDTLIASGALRAQPTFFEATTALALELFRRAGVDVAVIEVGLGGRLDSTNVITPMAARSPRSHSITRPTWAIPSPRSRRKRPASSSRRSRWSSAVCPMRRRAPSTAWPAIAARRSCGPGTASPWSHAIMRAALRRACGCERRHTITGKSPSRCTAPTRSGTPSWRRLLERTIVAPWRDRRGLAR